ncbi:type II toxin-antitoxin system MqsA family antitoxin [Sedimentibacter saalensis]|uniref:type II toxin-antitoxin system MqsA family antitoxin n=1 Tax=Sedimentibacter saalensis TaxID=130788 RepID=UPI0028974BF7|nr:type II toxin-antitoxin system MqsA family antitoxin [Sedimentibacter saalensis]
MKTNKYCFNCNDEVVTNIVEEMEVFNVKGMDISILSKKRVCSVCNEEIFDKELDSNTLYEVYEQYKKLNHLLTSEEIKKIRNKYGISQKGLALLLGWGEKTITRYENGSIQNNSHDTVLKSINEYQNFIVFWSKNKDKLSEMERDKVEENLYKDITSFTLKVVYKKPKQYTNVNSFVMVNDLKENEYRMAVV